MTAKYNKNQEPISLSKPLMDKLLKSGNYIELLGLYAFYYYTAKWQETNQPKATTNYVANGIGWSPDTVTKYKKKLIKLGLIEDVVRRDENNRIQGHYVHVNFIWSHPPEIATPGKSPGLDQSETNALSTGSLNALSDSSLNAYPPNPPGGNGKKCRPTAFNWVDVPQQEKLMIEQIRKSYPKRVAPAAARKAIWKVSQGDSSFGFLLGRTTQFARSKQAMTTPKQFIPHPATWFNNECFLEPDDDPKCWDEPYITGKPVKEERFKAASVEVDSF